jgi:hypothetical protein
LYTRSLYRKEVTINSSKFFFFHYLTISGPVKGDTFLGLFLKKVSLLRDLKLVTYQLSELELILLVVLTAKSARSVIRHFIFKS